MFVGYYTELVRLTKYKTCLNNHIPSVKFSDDYRCPERLLKKRFPICDKDDYHWDNNESIVTDYVIKVITRYNRIYKGGPLTDKELEEIAMKCNYCGGVLIPTGNNCSGVNVMCIDCRVEQEWNW